MGWWRLDVAIHGYFHHFRTAVRNSDYIVVCTGTVPDIVPGKL